MHSNPRGSRTLSSRRCASESTPAKEAKMKVKCSCLIKVLMQKTSCKQSKRFGQPQNFIILILICYKKADLLYAFLCLLRSLRPTKRIAGFRIELAHT